MFRRIFLLLGVLFSLSLFADERDFDFGYWTKQGMKFAIGPVTVEQAKQAIINWSGRQNLNIELLPLYAWGKTFMGRIPNFGISPSSITLPIAQYTTQYAFSVQDPNPDGKYTGTVLVDSYTGQIQELLKGLSELREDQNIANMLSPQQAMEKARQWVASYFPNIPIASMSVDFVFPPLSEDGSTWENYDDYVTFGFFNRTSTPDGETVELLLQSVIVMLDSNSGELLNMRVCYEPLEISPTPSLTKEEIAQIVASYLYGLGAQVVYIRDIGGPRRWYVAREEPYGQQRLYTYAIVGIEGLQSFPDSNY